jgi:hypothetical protein
LEHYLQEGVSMMVVESLTLEQQERVSALASVAESLLA